MESTSRYQNLCNEAKLVLRVEFRAFYVHIRKEKKCELVS